MDLNARDKHRHCDVSITPEPCQRFRPGLHALVSATSKPSSLRTPGRFSACGSTPSTPKRLGPLFSVPSPTRARRAGLCSLRQPFRCRPSGRRRGGAQPAPTGPTISTAPHGPRGSGAYGLQAKAHTGLASTDGACGPDCDSAGSRIGAEYPDAQIGRCSTCLRTIDHADCLDYRSPRLGF